MKYLVTGGAGFLGSHLCEQLLAAGHEVIAVDNFVTGNQTNVSSFANSPKFHLQTHDVTMPLPDELGKIDGIFHLASPASPNQASPKSYHALAFETMRVNTMATWQVCQYAVDHHAKLLFASTSEVYGDPTEHPQKESYRGNVSTTGPRAVYDEAKRFGETIVSAFVRSKNLDGRIIRIFNTYGPRMALDDGRAVIEFVTKALKNEPLDVFGDGSQTRSFCYVSDLVAGIIKALEMPHTTGEVINLGNPQEFTIVELAKLVLTETKSQSIISYKTLPQDDPLQRCPDITKAKALLGWQPTISLQEGLPKVIEYVKLL